MLELRCNDSKREVCVLVWVVRVINEARIASWDQVPDVTRTLTWSAFVRRPQGRFDCVGGSTAKQAFDRDQDNLVDLRLLSE